MVCCNTCKKESGDFFRCYKCNQAYKLLKPSDFKQDTIINKCIGCKKQCGTYKYCFTCNSNKEIEPKIIIHSNDNSNSNFNFIDDTD